jgi:hypothetical protein
VEAALEVDRDPGPAIPELHFGLEFGAVAGLALWWGTRSYHQAMV